MPTERDTEHHIRGRERVLLNIYRERGRREEGRGRREEEGRIRKYEGKIEMLWNCIIKVYTAIDDFIVQVIPFINVIRIQNDLCLIISIDSLSCIAVEERGSIEWWRSLGKV